MSAAAIEHVANTRPRGRLSRRLRALRRLIQRQGNAWRVRHDLRDLPDHLKRDIGLIDARRPSTNAWGSHLVS